MKVKSLALTSALALASSALAVAGGAGTAAGASPPRAAAAVAPTVSAPCGTGATAPTTYTHVALIMFENKPLKKIVGNTTDAPYLNSLIKACSYSKNDLSLSTTSLTNYIALTSGYKGCRTADSNGVCTSELEITSNKDTTVWPQASKSIFELMGNDAVEWGESMTTNCQLKSSGDFVINHTPFQYYTRTQATLCKANARPFPANAADTLSAKFNLIIPNKPHIMHLVPNTTVSQRIQNGDNWAKTFIPQLLSSAAYQSGNTAIIITWDEGNGSNFYVPLIVITPSTQAGGVSSVAYNHYSVLKGVQQMVGSASPLLGHAGDAGVGSIRDDAVFRIKP
ncbi:alkaline phosphatase family protein [Pedococcus sp. 2YAF34]|uniref:alkaline phosphatase family protein n=1 Tax=Pedococcus sp. 2YAF34 TaxID=3233032 RepID=UPI003F95E000